MNGTAQPMSSGKNRTRNAPRRARSWLSAAALVLAMAGAAGALALAAPAQARADACASVGGRHVSVGGCSDVAGTVEQYASSQDSTPPPPPPAPAGSVNACADVGRYFDVSGCVGTG
ncbi:hypothetical protein [Mycobacterium lacus]|nr:hypothetical protein [Mycobacterium lacus]ORW06944.1 hypothetical protein AWC15_20875 [Mycobacterium lacus]